VPDDVDTAKIREYPGCPACAEQILELCDALEAARLLARNMERERDHAHRGCAELKAQRDEARLTIRRIEEGGS
jgi:hypothetical protein